MEAEADRKRRTGGWWVAGAFAVFVCVGAWLACAPRPKPSVRAVAHETAEKPHRAARPEAEVAESFVPPAVPKSAASTTRTIRIVVVADAGGAAIEGADVQVDETRGRFVEKPDESVDHEETVVRTIDAKSGVDGVVAGTLTRAGAELVVRKIGFLVARRRIHRDENEIRVPLVAAIVVRGRVTIADTHEPAPGVPVRAWDTGKLNDFTADALIDDVVTRPDGRFELAGVPKGREFRVAAAKPGYRTADAILTLTEAVPEIELVLGDGGVLFGIVYDADGAPLADVDVFQIRPDMEELPQRLDGARSMTFAQVVTFLFPAVRTDAAGRYEFRGVRLPMEGVPQPRLAAARLANGRSARSAPATFTLHGERQQRDVRFANPSSITLTVKSTSPLPKDAKVRCQGNGPGSRDVERPLPQDGSPVVFPDLPANLYFVSVSTESDRPGLGWRLTRHVTLVDGKSMSVELVADDASRVEGRVVDAEGQGISSIHVEFSSFTDDEGLGVRAGAFSGVDGSFSLRRIPPLEGMLRVGPHEFAISLAMAGASSPPGVESREMSDVRPGGPPLTITLRRLGRLVGRVNPVPTQRHGGVQARAGGRTGRTEIEVADDGRFECLAPLVGEAAVAWFEFQGAPRAVIDLPAIASDETKDVGEIALAEGVALDGKLVDMEGRGIAAAQISTLEDWAGLRAASTDVAGSFRLIGLPKRPVLIKIDATHATPMTVFRIDPAASPATFVVGPGGLVKGRVLDADGKPVAEASVSVRPVGIAEDAEDAYGFTDADADGAYALRVQSGRAKLRAWPRIGNTPVEWVELVVADGETRTLDLHLR